MEETRETSWLTGRPVSGFGLPRGPLAALMGWLMRHGNDAEQRDVLSVLRPAAGERVVEVGYGPGGLVTALLDAGTDVVGVDPSAEMRAMARRRNRAAVDDGRADLRTGTAEATGLDGGQADAVVAVNNVVMWSDLAAGFAELHRVLRPGGRMVVSWHGGTQPSRMTRSMALDRKVLQRIQAAAGAVFPDAERRDLAHAVVFTGTR